MRIWAKIFKNNKLIRDMVVENYSSDTRTHKVLQAVDEVCYAFDLGKPIWLDSSIREFQKHARVRFRQDHFIEQIDFDFLELQVIEE